MEKKLETDEKGQERRKKHDKICIFFLKNKMTVEMIKWSIITIIHLSGVYLWLKNFNNISLPLENGKCILFVSLFFQQWIPIVYSKSTRLRVRRSIFSPPSIAFTFLGGKNYFSRLPSSDYRIQQYCVLHGDK